MTDDVSGDVPLAAGRFTTWLGDIGAAIRGERDSDVPCGECTACCEASQFVHVGPDEADALAHIPAALLFPAPGLPSGHRLMGYDAHGRCPMLVDGRCSIYAYRPRTCRTYDCRVFAAADVVDDDPTKAAVVARARRWRFDEPLPDDVTLHGAVRAAAGFLRAHATELPDALAPRTATQLAVLAVEAHGAFVADDEGRARDVAVADVVATVERHGGGASA